jgi:hypothetical protein
MAAIVAKNLADRTSLRNLRTEQIELLSQEAKYSLFELFYQKIVKSVADQRLKPTDAYSLLTELFEDCPESKLEEFFGLFKKVQTEIRLEAVNLHHCTKVVRTCMSKLTVTHDLQLRGALQRFLA